MQCKDDFHAGSHLHTLSMLQYLQKEKLAPVRKHLYTFFYRTLYSWRLPPCLGCRMTGSFPQGSSSADCASFPAFCAGTKQTPLNLLYFCSRRRKKNIIEGNANVCHLNKLTCKGTLRQVFICLRPRTPYPSPPPLHTVYV